LDVITNDALKKALKFTGRMGVLASEEEDTPVAWELGDEGRAEATQGGGEGGEEVIPSLYFSTAANR
jgi:fructose-1,6-bisphosphatase I